MSRASTLLGFSLVLFTSGVLLGADLNVPAAKAGYEAQRRVSDAAKITLDAEASQLGALQSLEQQAARAEQAARAQLQQDQNYLAQIDRSISNLETEISNLDSQVREYRRRLAALQNDYDAKERQRDQWERELQNTEREIRRLENRIAQLESHPHGGAWTCTYVDHGWEEHSGGHKATHSNQSAAEDAAKAACLAIHGNCDAAGCTQPDSPELANLRRRLSDTQQEATTLQNRLSSLVSEVASLQSNIDDTQRRIDEAEVSEGQKQNEISRLHRERESQVQVIAADRLDLNQKQNATAAAHAEVEQARPAYNAARAEYDRQIARTNALYAYWQEVTQNYNAALKEVLNQAGALADRHGLQEAEQRAASPGDAAGTLSGKSRGTEKGTADARERDRIEGYAEGRAKASTDASLAGGYQSGITDGKRLAQEKAAIENFPLGYNQALSNLLAAAPGQSATIDISESLPSDPGGNGNFLSLTPKVPGTKTPPAFGVPTQPSFAPPAFQAPQVAVPSPLNAFYSPACDGLPLEEFRPKCLAQYEATYKTSFRAYYETIFSTHFQTNFAATAPVAYQLALAEEHSDSFEAGRQGGAKDQGILNGFAESLETNQKEQFLIGQNAVSQDLSSGAVIVFRTASLNDADGDGLLSTGNAARLRVIIDNYGKEASAQARLRLTVSGTSGLGALNFVTRELPALPAGTRVTLEGTLSAKIVAEFAGQALQVQGALEVDADGSFKKMSDLSAVGEVHFPIELTEIAIAKAPNLGASVDAVLKFQNRTAVASVQRKLALSSSPSFITVDSKNLTVPAMAPGATSTVAVKMTPGVWVGENTYTRFVAESSTEDSKQTQAFAKYLHINRSVSLNLFDGNGKAVPGSTLQVKAGSQVTFYAQMVYHDTQYRPGPFVIRFAKASEAGIALVSGSTTSINYGSLSPTTPLQKQRFTVMVPASLQGKTGWVIVQAEEGGFLMHALAVYLEAK